MKINQNTALKWIRPYHIILLFLILALYGLYLFISYTYIANMLSGTEQAIFRAELAKDAIPNLIAILGIFAILSGLLEQIKITKLTEKQLEITNRPNLKISVHKGDGAVGSQSYKIICQNLGQGLHYIHGLIGKNKNSNLLYTFDLSDRYVPPQSELEFAITFSYKNELELHTIYQEIQLKFITLDEYQYTFNFGFQTNGDINYISLIKN